MKRAVRIKDCSKRWEINTSILQNRFLSESLRGRYCLTLMKKHFVTAFLLFSFLAFWETGIVVEALWHGWGGFGGVSLEYTKTGEIGTGILIFFIPVSTVVLFLIRIIGCKKRMEPVLELYPGCIGALLGISMVLGICFAAPDIADNSVIYKWGRQMAAFLIDCFHWMRFPV